MNIKKYMIVLAFSLLLSGCVHKFVLTNFSTGDVLSGSYNQIDKSMAVVMPDGEILKGKYSAVSGGSVTFGSAMFAGQPSQNFFGTAVTAGQGKAYAVLTSETSKLVMELFVIYSEWDGSGFGEARTNDGRTFKVQL